MDGTIPNRKSRYDRQSVSFADCTEQRATHRRSASTTI